MNETTIIMGIIGFVLGSIQYQLRIRLQDTKESMYRVIEHYCGLGNRMSIYKVLETMRSRLKMQNLGVDEKAEYSKCVKEWDSTHNSLHFWGVKFPLGILLLYAFYKIAIFWLSTTYVVKS